jgi:predicted MPP superfamily phosphohydrolase
MDSLAIRRMIRVAPVVTKMQSITILHLSDLHWSTAKSTDMKIVIDALCRDIATIARDAERRPDLVLFSGDLVLAGEDFAEFGVAKVNFIDPVLASAKLKLDNFYIVPGNHDISRQVVRSNTFVEAGALAMLTTDVKVNSFIDDLISKNKASTNVIERSNNFYSFVNKTIDVAPIISDPLLRVFSMLKDDLRIGIACFDTAWRATGESDDVDKNKLILGERNIDRAIAALEGSHFKIAVLHHPLNWLAEFDENVVSNRLYYGFDLISCGHVHDSLPIMTMTPAGNSIISQSGCLYQSRKFFNGYQIISIDLMAGEAEFFIRSYYDKRRAFDVDPKVSPGGRFKVPFRAKAASAPTGKVDHALRKLRGHIRSTAAEHISMREAQGTLRLDAKEAFVCPPLSRHILPGGLYAAQDESVAGHSKPEIIPLDDLLRSSRNLTFFGHKEVGKSSLAHFIAVNSAEGLVDHPRVPIVVDFRQFKKNNYGLRKAIQSYSDGLLTNSEIGRSAIL